MKYFSINLYRKMLNWALTEGISKESLRKLPIPFDKLDQFQAISAEDFFSVHELLDEQLGPGFAVRVGQQMKIEDYGVLGLSWRTCSWVGEIFERSERYFKLLSNTFLWQITQMGAVSRVYLDRVPYRRGLELSTEASLAATVVVLKQTSEKDIHPIEVSFKHQPPSDLSSYEAAFNCPLLFEQDAYYIAYRTEDLKLRTARADKLINQYLLQRVEEEAQGLDVTSNKLIPEVEDLIRQALPSGIPGMDFICDHLSMSRRTLSRRLSDEGVTYRDLISKTQEAIAKAYLQQPAYSMGYIAFETGFSEQSAFNRAFKRWTGLSPLEYRKNAKLQ
jgi:AraC-like DNA-binding protein